MDKSLSAVDRGLLRRLDHVRPAETETPSISPGATTAVSAQFDLRVILDAIQQTATSMRSMAERIRELEMHIEDCIVANKELEEQKQLLATNLEDAAQRRDDLSTSLDAEGERAKRLEAFTAQCIERGSSAERLLDATRTDLEKLVAAVASRLGA